MTASADFDPVGGLARRINRAGGRKVVLHVAGGGTEVFPWLLAHGGRSATLLAGRIPYDAADFHAILGVRPERLVDARAARGLAMAAFRHALRLRPDLGVDGVAGIGSTSKLTRGPFERENRAHEIHVAIQTGDRTVARSITLPSSLDRVGQERINALVILNLLGELNGLEGLPLAALGVTIPDRSISAVAAAATTSGPIGLPALLGGLVPWLAHRLDGPAQSGSPPTRLILPGSFRPLHAGHRRMAELAAELVGEPCAFELSLFHPAKPPLDYLSIADRVGRFAGVGGWLLLTDAPTYLEKARLFPGATFVVGHDTALRIIEPRWYGGVAGRDAKLDELETLGTRFLVFGRVDATGRFRDLDADTFDDPRVIQFVARTTRIVAETQFRSDLSSTMLRVEASEDFP